MDLAAINACRALENVGPLKLPSNWGALSPVEQGFVLIELERVNRGLAPIVGLSATLNGLASSGAHAGTDPSFPAGGGYAGGAIWAGAPSAVAADVLWMYADGPGGENLDCSSAGQAGCWGHRDIMLWDRPGGRLVAGGGYATAGGTSSFAYIVLSGYSTANLTFTWANELRYFATRPVVEPLSRSAAAAERRRRRIRHRRRHRHRHVRRAAPATSTGSSPTTSTGSSPTISFG